MSDIKRSTAEFQRPRVGAGESTLPDAGAGSTRRARTQMSVAAIWQGGEERGGDPYNATGRHALAPRAMQAQPHGDDQVESVRQT
jgi:hypothetical protein